MKVRFCVFVLCNKEALARVDFTTIVADKLIKSDLLLLRGFLTCSSLSVANKWIFTLHYTRLKSQQLIPQSYLPNMVMNEKYKISYGPNILYSHNLVQSNYLQTTFTQCICLFI